MSHITQEPSKEEFALGSFLSAMHESNLDGTAMRAAMLKALGMDGAALAQQEPVSQARAEAWKYDNEAGVSFLTFNDPKSWHDHDKHGFKNFKPLFLEQPEPLKPMGKKIGCVQHDCAECVARSARTEPVLPVLDKQMLWLWKNGDHYLAFDNLYPCFTQGGDPMTLGEPAAKAIFRTSFAAAKGGAL